MALRAPLGPRCSLFLALALAAPALAAAPARPVVARAPASAGQLALAVGFDASSRLFAAVCPSGACALERGQELPLPEAARALASSAELALVPIGSGRRAVVVTIADPPNARSWRAVVVAPLGGAAPKVVFAGWTGLVEGEPGLRHGPMVLIGDAEPDGSRRIVIGEQREDLSLCGRPAVLAPKLLLGQDLELHPAKVQRLGAAEIAQATPLAARPLEGATARASFPLLRAVAATSAVGLPGALTDGDLETTWSENRGGAGRGEFVLMNAPSQVAITGFQLVVRPARASVDHGTSPKSFFLATSDQLFRVTLPENAWEKPGARYEMTLPWPIRTDCLALVTDSAFDESRDARTTFAELSVETDFDAAKMDELVRALAGGDAHAEAAAAVLVALGAPAFESVAKAFDGLDEGGRRVALDVIDHAPCEASVPVYLRALVGSYRAHRLHARDRVARCGEAAADSIEAALRTAKPRPASVLAGELAVVAPARAVRAIAPLLDAPSAPLRQLLRVALARAADAPAAATAVRAALADRTLSERARVDLLRALGPRLAAFRPEAEQAFSALAGSRASFRTRFLLLEPAASLARASATARDYLSQALERDPDPHVRAQAASAVEEPERFRAPLLRAVGDPEVRVREAAIRTLGERGGGFAVAALALRLRDDPWPLVRVAAADALAALGADASADQALVAALADESPAARVAVVRALGRRRVVAALPALRERVDDAEETIEVRVAAATALGHLCDSGSLELLTRYAQKLADPFAPADAKSIGPAAVAALGRLHPPDLAQRLAPLGGKRTPVAARFAVRGALAGSGSCGRAR
ncbi:MAG: HEAT repeat domain-containing protein [Sorangiineae bacterium]|nr:HEAT repeat domain-containing protein [Polyangiaceae bacterium]MEB2323204.1 HEAT repeat domain-containing protein [Sorangiineae bacterium]